MDNARPTIYLFTDGASSGNPGPGGYGIVLRCGSLEKEMSGGFARTTNNRMELMAVIVGLEAVKWQNAIVQVCSDSKYVVDAVSKGWLFNWERNGWKKSDRKPALNVEYWTELLDLLETHEVEFCWVKGHAGHPENERCDALAVAQTKKYLQA